MNILPSWKLRFSDWINFWIFVTLRPELSVQMLTLQVLQAMLQIYIWLIWKMIQIFNMNLQHCHDEALTGFKHEEMWRHIFFSCLNYFVLSQKSKMKRVLVFFQIAAWPAFDQFQNNNLVQCVHTVKAVSCKQVLAEQYHVMSPGWLRLWHLNVQEKTLKRDDWQFIVIIFTKPWVSAVWESFFKKAYSTRLYHVNLARPPALQVTSPTP